MTCKTTNTSDQVNTITGMMLSSRRVKKFIGLLWLRAAMAAPGLPGAAVLTSYEILASWKRICQLPRAYRNP